MFRFNLKISFNSKTFQFEFMGVELVIEVVLKLNMY